MQVGKKAKYNITITVQDVETDSAIGTTYRGVSRADAMKQPALASAVLLLEHAELGEQDDEESA